MRFVRFSPRTERKGLSRTDIRCTIEILDGRRLLTVGLPVPSPMPLLPIYDPTGMVSFSQPSYLESNRSGVATVTLTRPSPIGEARVDFATSDGSATAGVDYAAVRQVVDFHDGEMSKTVAIPLVNHPLDRPEETVYLTLTHPATGQLLGAPATLTIADRADVTPPTVRDVHLVWAGKSITGVSLTFSEPMDPAAVADVANYHVRGTITPGPLATRPYHPPGPLNVQSATYDPLTSTVVLATDRPLKAGETYSIQVGGPTGGPSTLTDLAGNHLDGNGQGVGDGYFNGSIVGGTSIRLGVGPTLRLTRGGTMELLDGSQLRLEGTSPGRSVLSASSDGGRRGGIGIFAPLDVVSPVPFQNRLRGPLVDVRSVEVGPDAAIDLDQVQPVFYGPAFPLVATGVPKAVPGGPRVAHPAIKLV